MDGLSINTGGHFLQPADIVGKRYLDDDLLDRQKRVFYTARAAKEVV
jgi:hypothetical protein